MENEPINTPPVDTPTADGDIPVDTPPAEPPVDMPAPGSIDNLLRIANATNIDDAVKWAENANQLIGRSIQLPENPTEEDIALINRKLSSRGLDIIAKPDLSDPEQRKEFQKLLGVPDSPDGYKLPEVEEMPINEEAAKRFLEDAHKAGLTQEQAEFLIRNELEMSLAQKQEMEKEQFEREKALKERYGYSYDEKISEAESLFKYGFEEEDFNSLPVKVKEGFIKIIDKISSLQAEPNTFGRPSQPAKLSDDEAKAKISEITSKLLTMKPGDVGYKELLSKKKELYKQVYPGGNGSLGGVQFS